MHYYSLFTVLIVQYYVLKWLKGSAYNLAYSVWMGFDFPFVEVL